jgi:crotonobetainyl-CoA:carnitine CoA-transferase CaiB-like acyl-CoA transferase
MLETTMAHLPDAALEVTLNHRLPQPIGNAEFGVFPVDAFPCLGNDNWVAIAVHDETEWAALCRTIGAPDLLADPHFSTPDARASQRDEVMQRIARWTSGLQAQTAMELLQAAGVPAGVSYDDAQIQANPHFRERGFMELVDHHVCGDRFVASVPWKISGVPAPPRLRRVPQWGEHNEYVLHELLQLPREAIDALIADGIVSRRP